MTTKPASGVLLWLSWVVVTSLGSALGFASMAIYPFGGSWGESDSEMYFVLLNTGILIGFGQWLILRTALKKTWAWILATAIGLPAGIYIGFYILSTNFESLINGVASICMVGVIIGVLQWYALFKRLNSVLWWILVSALSWGIGIIVPIFLIPRYPSFTTLGALAGVLVGTISGAFVKPCIFNQILPETDLTS